MLTCGTIAVRGLFNGWLCHRKRNERYESWADGYSWRAGGDGIGRRGPGKPVGGRKGGRVWTFVLRLLSRGAATRSTRVSRRRTSRLSGAIVSQRARMARMHGAFSRSPSGSRVGSYSEFTGRARLEILCRDIYVEIYFITKAVG